MLILVVLTLVYSHAIDRQVQRVFKNFWPTVEESWSLVTNKEKQTLPIHWVPFPSAVPQSSLSSLLHFKVLLFLVCQTRLFHQALPLFITFQIHSVQNYIWPFQASRSFSQRSISSFETSSPLDILRSLPTDRKQTSGFIQLVHLNTCPGEDSLVGCNFTHPSNVCTSMACRSLLLHYNQGSYFQWLAVLDPEAKQI